MVWLKVSSAKVQVIGVVVEQAEVADTGDADRSVSPPELVPR